ncbi:MAG: VOC family protein [Cyclobacteriaceae bacterium]
MLRDATIFSSFSTDQLLESYHFYRNILGLNVALIDDRFLHIYLENNGYLVVYYKQNHIPAAHTVLNFQIENIEYLVDQLSVKGIVFLQYTYPIKTDTKGISWDEKGSQIAWFKDPGGNILALIEG